MDSKEKPAVSTAGFLLFDLTEMGIMKAQLINGASPIPKLRDCWDTAQGS
jgi:hypothetical protein